MAAVILAAGRASRMGQPKVLLPWRGQGLLGHVLATVRAAGADPIVVVTGPDTPSLGDLGPFEPVFNPEARSGMGGSIACGIRAVVGRADAALICLGDQPGIAADTISALVAACAAGAPAAYPLYAVGGRGHPVLFSAALFSDLSRLAGERGARDILASCGAKAVAVPGQNPADVDTPEDYAALVEGS